MEQIRKLIRKIINENYIPPENRINKVLAETLKYKIVQVQNSFRIVNYSKFYRRTVPYIEISKEQALKFVYELNKWRELQTGKEGRAQASSSFNLTAEEMFHNKNTEKFLEDDDDY